MNNAGLPPKVKFLLAQFEIMSDWNKAAFVVELINGLCQQADLSNDESTTTGKHIGKILKKAGILK